MTTKLFTIEDAYKQNKELEKEDVLVLQAWLDKQPHLPKIDEMKLIVFLHACYYKVEATKTCIDNFFTLKAHWPEFSFQRNVFTDEVRQSLHVLLTSVLDYPSKPDHMVLYARLYDNNPALFDFNNVVKAADMVTRSWIKVLGTYAGQVLVLDVQGVSFSHVIKINLMGIKKLLFYVQEAFPWRLKAAHIIHISPAFQKLFNLAKPFIKDDLLKIIFLHSNLDSFYENIPQSCLPNELGGEAGSFQELYEKQMTLVEENAEYLLQEEKEIADESKRQEKSTFQQDIFGIDGSFKKLDID